MWCRDLPGVSVCAAGGWGPRRGKVVCRLRSGPAAAPGWLRLRFRSSRGADRVVRPYAVNGTHLRLSAGPTDSHVASPALVVSAEARPLFVSGLRDTYLISPRCIFWAPTAAQRSGCGGERRRNGTSKPSRMRGGAGCGVSADDRRRFGEILRMTEYDTFRFVIARPVRTLAAAIRIPRGVGDAAPYKG